MKLIISLILALATIASAAPALEQVKRDPKCDDCNNRFQFCYKNGWAHGIDKCAETCAQHVCYQTPGCRGCGNNFVKCPAVSRYHVACGDKPCSP